VSRIFLTLYAIARRSGILRTRLGDALFNRAYFAYKRLLEDPFAALVRNAPELFANGHIVDVGANIGYTTVLFARAAAEPFRVFAFEPEEENFRRLAANVRRHGVAARTALVQAAAGDSDGAVPLWRNERHHGDHRVATPAFAAGHSGFVDVPLVALDTFARERIDGPIAFVKIDVQGFEPSVLRGMEAILDANPTLVVATEIAPHALAELGFTVADATEPLLRRGFLPHAIERGRLVQLPAGGIAAGKRGYVDVVWRRATPSPSFTRRKPTSVIRSSIAPWLMRSMFVAP
jgi:FkbM family methyltransferase